MMNTIDSLRMVLIYAIAQMIAAYDALASEPDAWPDGAEWYAIDANGIAWWYWGGEPTPVGLRWVGTVSVKAGFISIPLGIDWRLCKWQRPEVAQ